MIKKPPCRTQEEADARVEEWHGNGETNMPCHDYLGWTWDQYAYWVEKGELHPVLNEIREDGSLGSSL